VIIIGIDPGTIRCGYGVIESHENNARYIASGAICPGRSAIAMHIRLQTIYREIDQVVARYQPNHIALEKAFFYKNAKSAFALGQVRGVILLLAADKGLALFEYNPTEIKQAVAGFGRAEKKQVKTMVQVILTIHDAIGEDAADALALCICHANSFKMRTMAP
jgi:crossover junction endodeoxyribonuclease RuvC